MSQGAIFLHFGHVASADAAFFLATLVYVPVGAIALVAAIDIAARNGSAWRSASWRATTRLGGSRRRPRSCWFSAAASI